ncbi:hypothetical protein AA0Z99_13520 [Agrococcus sp. 1P02AA]|uniref:hypothetical protein n=1 Tax=Agrococcus sp. 1P02AA TaxID=3132259 RepID=UPI0039A60E53
MARRSRFSAAHALAWVVLGLAAAALATDAVSRDGGAVALALGTAAATAAGAVGLLAPARMGARTILLVSSALVSASVGIAAALVVLGQPPQLPIAAVLGLAAGAQIAGMRLAVGDDPALAPRVRPAPTLLAAAAGVAIVAAAALLPSGGLSTALMLGVVLQLLAVVLVASSPVPAAAGTAPAEPGSADGGTAAARLAVPLLALLAVAAAGAVALAALRPGLSAIGAEEPQPAGPIALTLALGALLGPPLAMVVERFGGTSAATLATVGGAAALIAPIARPGTLDLVAAAGLGIALAASVALVEVARRSGQRLAPGGSALIVLAGAAGATLAALLLSAVPLADVVLGAAIACLVAGIGVWAPGPRSSVRAA